MSFLSIREAARTFSPPYILPNRCGFFFSLRQPLPVPWVLPFYIYVHTVQLAFPDNCSVPRAAFTCRITSHWVLQRGPFYCCRRLLGWVLFFFVGLFLGDGNFHSPDSWESPPSISVHHSADLTYLGNSFLFSDKTLLGSETFPPFSFLQSLFLVTLQFWVCPPRSRITSSPPPSFHGPSSSDHPPSLPIFSLRNE